MSGYGYTEIYQNPETDEVTLSNPIKVSTKDTTYKDAGYPTIYWKGWMDLSDSNQDSVTFSQTVYYKFVCTKSQSGSQYIFNVYKVTRTDPIQYSKGDFIEYLYGTASQYPKNARLDDYWYVRNSLMPKYTIYKYDKDLNLKSRYDVDTKVLTTEQISITNKENTKVQLTLTATGSDYKVYISNDNATWQQVTDITTKIPKELNVDGWEKLYIKIETNTSRIDKIDVSYYKN